MSSNRQVNQPRGGTQQQQNTQAFASSSSLRSSMAQMNETQSQRRIFSSLQQQPSMSFTNSSSRGLSFSSQQMVISDSKLQGQQEGPTNNMRREKDVRKLLMSQYDVQLTNEDDTKNFRVIFYGPKDSPYEGGKWEVKVTLPDQYPYKSPSIGFSNKIYHPNIDEMSGSVCLDVINQTWSPMYDLLNIFEIFLPQLLLYPNPKDPLNSDAAKLLMSDETSYKKKVQDYIKKFASESSLNDKDDNQKSQSKIQREGQDLSGVKVGGTKSLLGKKDDNEQQRCNYEDNLSETSLVKLDSGDEDNDLEDVEDPDELEDCSDEEEAAARSSISKKDQTLSVGDQKARMTEGPKIKFSVYKVEMDTKAAPSSVVSASCSRKRRNTERDSKLDQQDDCLEQQGEEDESCWDEGSGKKIQRIE